jgi:hypothetical protein
VQPDPLNVWAATFKDVSLDQIKSGLKRVSESDLEFPPAMPQFKKMCLMRSQADHIRDIVKADKARAAALPKPSSKEVAKKYIAEIRAKATGKL